MYNCEGYLSKAPVLDLFDKSDTGLTVIYKQIMSESMLKKGAF
jgi:hypothetical protein